MFGARMRRILCWGMAAGLTASTLGGILLPTPSVAVVGPGPAAAAAANWLVQQLNDDGLLLQDGEPDIGLTMDAVFSLNNVGGHTEAVNAMKAGIATNLDDYVEGDIGNDSNAVALAAAYAVRIGENPRNFAGTNLNLISRLEARIVDDPPVVVDDPTSQHGRLQDLSGSPELANPRGQAAAVEALFRASSSRAEDALAFLQKQQCGPATDGFYRDMFTPMGSPSANQTCDAAPDDERVQDTDTTATVVSMIERLEFLGMVPGYASGNARSWLLTRYGKDLGFRTKTGNASTLRNSISSSLTGTALSRDYPEAVALAALWIRRLQAFSPAPCVSKLSNESGAIALLEGDYDAGVLQGIVRQPTQSRPTPPIDDWVRATVYSIDVLRFEASVAGGPTIDGPTSFVEARKGITLTVKNLDLRERICVSGPSGNPRLINATAASTSLKLYTPAGTGLRTFRVVGMQGVDTHSVIALDKTTLKLKVGKYYVKRGAKQKISVSGLAAGERVTVKVKGSKLIKGVASATGKFSKKFKVKAKRGKVKITVTGQFASRTNRIPFKVL